MNIFPKSLSIKTIIILEYVFIIILVANAIVLQNYLLY
jgi:hypothetical protein